MPPAVPAGRSSTRARSRRPLLLLAVPFFLVVVVAGLFGVRAWVDHFMRSDDFRHFLDHKASVLLRADGRFQPLHWQDTEVYSDAFEATGNPGSPLAEIDAEQVRARLNLRALWDHVWRIDSVEVEKFAATLGSTRPAPPDAAASESIKPTVSASDRETPGFLASWLPNRVEIGEVRVNDFSLGWNSGRVSGTRLIAQPREGGPQNWEVNGTGGQLAQEHFPTVRLTRFNVKSSTQEIFITRAEGQAESGGHLELSGKQSLEADRATDLTANFEGVPITDFLPPDWRARLHGNATGTVQLTGSASDEGSWHARGHADLSDGHLEALPMLDQLAVFTATDRYRLAALQKGHADFDYTREKMTVSNLVLESEGLLRIEGAFTVHGDQIEGTFQVGVSRSSLRWIASVGLQVFNLPEHDGYVWTTTHLRGPVRHPAEDLTPRLIAAAQQAVIDKGTQGAKSVLDTASSLLDLLKKP